ncbi:MAG TPA: NAD(P)/FAD-dependent oxidoreductase [Candidatus Limnocylindria bacterium]
MSDSSVRTDVLLIGGGVASVRCARTLRREGFDGRIAIVGDERDMPVNRPPLSKELLRDDLPDDLVLAEPASWYERRNVELLTGRRVVGLDLQASEATLDDGARTLFDRCLLATGAEPRRLPITGGEGALLLRTLADARRLRQLANSAGPGAPVVIVGGSFIGIEVASSLAALGLRPTIVEIGERLWAGRMGSELATWAADRLGGAGIALRLGATATRTDEAGLWLGGELLPAAFVVAGVGVRPRVELAERAGLEVRDGIVVDGRQRTSHPAAWAAGDVARRGAVRIEHWHAAREDGERSARSMLGLPVDPAPEPWFFSEVAGTPLDIVGMAPEWDDERWLDDRVLAFSDGGRVVQLVSIGSRMGAGRMRELVAARASLATAADAVRAG